MVPPALAAAPAPRPNLVVVGNGMAAIRTIEDVLARCPGRYHITVLGAEPHGHYNRILLSSVLAGDKSMAEIVTHTPEWYAEQGITLHRGDAVTAIDPERRTVTAASGRVVAWDRLVLATGAAPVLPPIPGMDLPGICAFRDAADVAAMLAASGTHRRAVIIGGGVLGLEAAWGLKQQGMEVSVVHLMPSLMERQLDEAAAGLLRRDLDARGIACVTGARAAAVAGSDRAEGVVLSDGRCLPADLVVVAVGIRPRTDLAQAAGLAVGRGVLVDDHMRTSHPGILAVGECVEHDGQCFGLVTPLYGMAEVCADMLAGIEQPRRFRPQAVPTHLKIPGIDLFSAGAVAAANDSETELVEHDPDHRVYRKLVLRQGRVVGAILYGDVRGGSRFLQWMRDGTDVGGQCAEDCFCRGLLEPEADSDDALVCHCNGITRGMIVGAIREHGLTELEQVCLRTRAGTACGQCRVATARILAETIGIDAEAEMAAVARRAKAMRQGFRVWHHSNAVLMAMLMLTGIALHFPAARSVLLGFEWSHILHKWSGIALCVGYGGFLALCRVFRRQFRADADGLTMFAVMPLVVISGLAFLWPALLPARLFGISALAPLAVGHTALAVLMLMFLLHHLSHAPWSWWRKRKLRTLGG